MAKHRRLFRPQASVEELLPLIEDWYQTPKGQSLLSKEQLLIDEQLEGCFGYYLLQLSVSGQVELFGNSTIGTNFRGHPLLWESGDSVFPDVLTSYEALPIETDSLDAAIIHHAHEFVANPHEVLRELQRVLRPRGRLILTGFNPWSLLGLNTLLSRMKTNSPWHQHLISSHRLVDWLSLLGFSVLKVKYVYPRQWPEFKSPLLHRCSTFLEGNFHRTPFGACYIISAIKDVSAMTPEKPLWSSMARPFRGLSPINPARSKEVA